MTYVTVVRNNAVTLPKAIESVRDQTYPNVEHVILDGASTDTTLDVIRGYGDQVDYFASEADSGIYDALDKAIPLSRGELICVLNSDDWLEPNAAEMAVSNLTALETPALLLSAATVMRNGGDENPTPLSKWDPAVVHPGCYFTCADVCHNGIYATRSAYEDSGPYDRTYDVAADFGWIMSCLEAGISFTYKNEATVNYVQGGASSDADKHSRECVRVMCERFPSLTDDEAHGLYHTFFRFQPAATIPIPAQNTSRFLDRILTAHANEIDFLHAIAWALLTHPPTSSAEPRRGNSGNGPAERDDTGPAIGHASSSGAIPTQNEAPRDETDRPLRPRGSREPSEVEVLETALQDTREALRAMEATVSWRITRPLRAIRRAERTRLRREPGAHRRDSLASTDLERAVASRLEQCFVLLSSSAEPPTPGVHPSSVNESLAKLEAVLASTSVPHVAGAWLALLCITGSYPIEEDVDEATRAWLSEGPHGVVELLSEPLRFALGQATSANRLDIVCEQVVIDVTQIASSDLHTGVQRVAREVVTRWARTHPSTCLAFFDPECNAFRLLSSPERDRVLRWEEELGASGSPVAERDPDVSTGVLVPWDCQIVVPELPDTRRVRALRGLTAAQVCRAVSLIGYDLIPVVAAEAVPPGIPERFSQYLTLLRQANRVSAISRQSADGFRAFTSMLAGLGAPGPEVQSHSLPTVVPPVSDEDIEAARETIGLGEIPLLLAVGTDEPRKNHVLVLEAAERLWKDGHEFGVAFIGGAGWKSSSGFGRLVRNLETLGRPVVVRRRVSERELWAAYRLARFTVFASLIEGYGLPVAESLASGTPVIASNYGSMAEIAEGGGALLVDPRNVDDVAEQMRRLLSDDELLERLRTEARARDFGSWDEYAQKVWSFLVEDGSEAAA